MDRILTETDTRHDLRLHVVLSDDGTLHEVRLEDAQLRSDPFESSEDECHLETQRGFRAGYTTPRTATAAGLLVWPGEVFVNSDNGEDEFNSRFGEEVALGTTAVDLGGIALVALLVTDLANPNGAIRPFRCKERVMNVTTEENEVSEWLQEFLVRTHPGSSAASAVHSRGRGRSDTAERRLRTALDPRCRRRRDRPRGVAELST
ncbi:MAG: hypothetical protein ACJAYU_003195 [Bradymonadia bacterium]|jgi:hypothetical protein